MIGDKLKRERERQGLTVKDVEKGTSIRAFYIESIENADWASLPGDVYVKGFIRNLAGFLKMDADACVKEYIIDTKGEEPEEENEDIGEKKNNSTTDIQNHAQSEHRRQNILVAAMLGVVLLGGVYLILGMDDEKQVADVRTSTSTADNRKNETTERNVDKNIGTNRDNKNGGATAEKVNNSPVAKKDDNKAGNSQVAKKDDHKSGNTKPNTSSDNKVQKADEVSVTATLNDRCWLKVTADGKTLYEGTAEKGKIMSWKGAERIAITAGNAGALEITYNGRNMGQAGNYGEVIDKVFTKESVN